MASNNNNDQPHFLLFPLMSPGHMIPMIDFAILLSRQGITVTVVTTPHNAARYAAAQAAVRFVELELPTEEAGLPPGCENFDQLPSLGLGVNIFVAAAMLHEPAEEVFRRLTPRPACIISDVCLPWTLQIAKKFNIPRITFQSLSCFLLISLNCLQHLPKVLENLKSETDPFTLPGMPDEIEFTKSQLPIDPDPRMREFGEKIMAAEKDTYGFVINTFEELEPEYVEEYRKFKNGKAWFVGPVSLCNEAESDKLERGNKALITITEEGSPMKWLDSREPNSVLYVCFGSMCNLIPAQLIELGLGLESTNKPFIWVIREKNWTKELEEWFSVHEFEEKTRGRGMVIKGWAPQILILAHKAIGGFLTHCGWNSSLEAICAGVPVVTWPLFADQFANEKLLVDVLGIGVKVGVQKMVNWNVEEEVGVLVRSEGVRQAIDELMGGEDKEERRERAKKLAEIASISVREGGSSYVNTKMFIQEIMGQSKGCENETQQ